MSAKASRSAGDSASGSLGRLASGPDGRKAMTFDGRGGASIGLGGAASAFVSTLVSARALHRGRREDSLLPYALYRCLLAALVLRRLRSTHNRSR